MPETDSRNLVGPCSFAGFDHAGADRSWDVKGIRINLIHGRNHNVEILDVGLLNETTDWEHG